MEPKCPYCREPMPKTEEDALQNLMKRVKVNDHVALCKVGKNRYNEGDYEGAIEFYTKAVSFGSMIAHFNVSLMYYKGEGVERDLKKEVYHLEEASIGGHPEARYNLGCQEEDSGRYDRAVKHWIIAANLALDGALEKVKNGFQRGWVSKDDYLAALRGHQAAVDATKSDQREEAEEAGHGRRPNCIIS